MNILVTGGAVTNGAGIFCGYSELQYMKPSRDHLYSLYHDKQLSLSDIGKQYGVTHGAVLKWFKSLDIPRRSVKESVSKELNKHHGNQYGRIHTVNVDFFKHWNSDMAWLLGFLCADGCIEDDRTLSACQKEVEPLQHMITLLNSDSNIETKKQNGWSQTNIYRVRVHCKEIIQDLNNLGVFARKSLTLKLPDVPMLYIGDFIRGYFDGDGSICHYRRYPNNPKISFVGSRDFIESLEQTLHSLGCSKRKLDNYNPKTPKIVYGSKKDVLLIGHLMYKDSNKTVSLTRKRFIYETWVKK